MSVMETRGIDLAAVVHAGTQEEAAAAYDLAAIEYRGLNAVTNFDISHYIKDPTPPRKLPPNLQTPMPDDDYDDDDEEEAEEEETPSTQKQQQQQRFGGGGGGGGAGAGGGGGAGAGLPLSEEEAPPPTTTRLPTPDLPDSIVDQSTMMDGGYDHHHSYTYTWGLCCMDSGGGGYDDTLPVPHFALERSNELPPLFKDDVFEDNIEYLFEGGGGGNINAGTGKEQEEEEKKNQNGCSTSNSGSSSISSGISLNGILGTSDETEGGLLGMRREEEECERKKRAAEKMSSVSYSISICS